MGNVDYWCKVYYVDTLRMENVYYLIRLYYVDTRYIWETYIIVECILWILGV